MRWTALALLAPAAVAAPLDRAEVTRCLAAAVAEAERMEACMEILRAPCDPLLTAERFVRYGDCASDLARRIEAQARADLADRAPLMPEPERIELEAALDGALDAGRRRCLGSAPAGTPLEVARALEGECRLRSAALVAHILEFHPSRLIARPEDAT